MPPETRVSSPLSPVRPGGRALPEQPEPRGAWSRPGGHGAGGRARWGDTGKTGLGEQERAPPASAWTPARARKGDRSGRQYPGATAPCPRPRPCPAVGGVGVCPGAPPFPAPAPRPTPGLAGPPSRPYPGHDAQDGVRLPDQGVGVEGAPGFARSVSTPFHRGCTRAVPPARRAPPTGARARPPPTASPAGRLARPRAPRGGVVRGGRVAGAARRGRGEGAGAARALDRGGAVAADPVQGALVSCAVTSLLSGGGGGEGGRGVCRGLCAANAGRVHGPGAASLPVPCFLLLCLSPIIGSGVGGASLSSSSRGAWHTAEAAGRFLE